VDGKHVSHGERNAVRKLLIFIICLLPAIASATTPTITNVTGTVSTGQTLTIAGLNLLDEDNTNWANLSSSIHGPNFQSTDYGFEGPSTDYCYGGTCNGVYSTSIKLMGSNSMMFSQSGAHGQCGESPSCAISHESFPLAMDNHYGRAYVRYDNTSGVWPSIAWKNIDVQAGTNNVYFQWDASGSAPTRALVNIGGNNYFGNIPSGAMQSGRWYCIEWMYSASTGTATEWIDGQQIVTHSMTSSGQGYLDFGMVNIQGTTSGWAMQQYIDNMAISTTRVYPSTIVEISGDGGTTWTYQPPTSLSETSIAITANLPTLTAANYILRVTNNGQMVAAAGNTATAGGATYALGGGSGGNASISLTGLGSSGSNGIITSPVSGAQLIFSEGFDDTNFAARGWYDGIPSSIATTGCYSGAGCSIWTFNSGGTNPTQMPAGSMRHEFTATDTIYTSFWIKFATGWEGSQQTAHPHIICLLSDLDDTANPYSALAANYLNTYIEFHSDVFASQGDYNIYSQIDLQDEKNTNPNYGAVPDDLRAMTENRSVNQCNTPSYDGAVASCYADGVTCTSGMNCYPSGTSYYSANDWIATTPPVSTGAWHHIEAYMKMNSIVGGIGQTDGIMQEWMDGTQTINFSNMIYRTGQHPTMKWAQFTISPFIGNGSPVTQTMYIDSLAVYNGLPGTASSSSLNLSGLGGTCGTGSITAAMTYSPVVSLTGNGCGSGVGYPGGMGVGAGIQAIFSNVIMQ